MTPEEAERAAKGLTPTEDLIMEVLAARTRLGHGYWTFDRNRVSMKAANHLEALGFVRLLHGITYGTFRARITRSGRSVYMTSDYVAPILGGPK